MVDVEESWRVFAAKDPIQNQFLDTHTRTQRKTGQKKEEHWQSMELFKGPDHIFPLTREGEQHNNYSGTNEIFKYIEKIAVLFLDVTDTKGVRWSNIRRIRQIQLWHCKPAKFSNNALEDFDSWVPSTTHLLSNTFKHGNLCAHACVQKNTIAPRINGSVGQVDHVLRNQPELWTLQGGPFLREKI